MALAVFWALLVPVFQEPDESNHFDYAVTLLSAQRPLFAREAPGATETHPYVKYLAKQTSAHELRFNKLARVPEGYGTRAFFQRSDAHAPSLNPADFAYGRIHPMPYLVRTYPPGFYALAAVAMTAASVISPRSPAVLFFTARFVCVGLLAITLVLTALLLRDVPLARWQRHALFAAIAFLPLTGWMSGYVQPDNLSFTLVTALFVAVPLYLRAPRSPAAALCTGLLFAALLLTKQSYFAVMAVAFAAVFTANTIATKARLAALRQLPLLVLPPLAALWAVQTLTWAPASLENFCAAPNQLARAFSPGILPGMLFAVDLFSSSVRSIFDWAFEVQTYWLVFTWGGYPILIGNGLLTELIFRVIRALTIAIAAAIAVRVLINLARIGRVARGRGAAAAARIIARQYLFLSFAAFYLFMVGFTMYTSGAIAPVGRYFLPFIVPSVLCATLWVPRSLPRALWRPASAAMTALLLLFSVVASASAPAAVYNRFYGPKADAPYVQSSLEFDAPAFAVPSLAHTAFLGRVKRGAPLKVSGWSFDGAALAPWTSLLLFVDGRPAATIDYHLKRDDLACRLTDSDLTRSGFAAVLQTSALEPGEHVVVLAGRSAAEGELAPIDWRGFFDVTAP